MWKPVDICYLNYTTFLLVTAALLMSIIVLAFKSIDELKNKICKNDFMTDNFLPADF